LPRHDPGNGGGDVCVRKSAASEFETILLYQRRCWKGNAHCGDSVLAGLEFAVNAHEGCGDARGSGPGFAEC
jgi:hypothetical protein